MDDGLRTHRTSLDAMRCTCSPTQEPARDSRSLSMAGPRRRGRAMGEELLLHDRTIGLADKRR
jgi:hypothetical protein